jgi:hypothetical protein
MMIKQMGGRSDDGYRKFKTSLTETYEFTATDDKIIFLTENQKMAEMIYNDIKENKEIPFSVETLIKNLQVDQQLATIDLNVDVESMVDNMFEKYFGHIFNNYGIRYNYVTSKKWNPADICLNSNFDDSPIGSGHCVIITIMFVNYLSASGEDLEKAYQKFGNLSRDEMIVLIGNCTTNIYTEIIANLPKSQSELDD